MKSLMESLYRWLDRQLFRARSFDLDLVQRLVEAAPGQQFYLGGFPAEQLESGVRAYLGSAMALPVEVRHNASSELIYLGQMCLDHRSLSRSVLGVISKLPAAQAMAARMQETPDSPRAVRPASPRPRSATQLLVQLFQDSIRALSTREQWALAVGNWCSSSRTFAAHQVIKPPPDRFWADPFIAEIEGKRWVFFEELVYAENRGKIAAFELGPDGQCVGESQRVLEAPFHLSYPFMLRDQGRLYMIPESSANRTVDLYVNEGRFKDWTHVKTLVAGDRLADATVIHHDGLWWMFATRGDVGAAMHDELVIYWAATLEGDWTPHAANPVKIDARSSRPAGAMWVAEGCIHRPVQDCSARYGSNIRVQRVVELSPTHFHEEDLGSIARNGTPDALGLHTLSVCGSLGCIDLLMQLPK